MGPLTPDRSELVLGLICFFLIFGILGKLLLPRIERVLAQREDAIEGGQARAEAQLAEAQRVYEEYRAEIAAARQEAAQIRQTAAEQGAAYLAEVRAEGIAQRDRVVAAAKVQLEADRVIAEAELREDVARVAVELAGRILGESVAELPSTQAVVDGFFAESAAV
ncbi:ATP synthase F0 subunit B [Kitasatospora sp. MMS16-BH015]|uniref:F0F1 ATP synthase subunit B n=1 Tax=Kitasatospora sp. MMS16-BH015 TaxID=2018025 RepID=UPI000CA15D21|nr:F0F1 ATP synthase subunit B [Kitasatospora sp. MMS16-BH015]AUG78422.1 ATP synthase F0 subunit B [Kitasatospora sp. MMS16-BH015]